MPRIIRGVALALAFIVVGPVAARADSLPDGRAYELVTPADKAGGDVLFPAIGIFAAPFSLTGVSADGDRVISASFQAFPGAPGGNPNSYESVRTAHGWDTTDISPPPGGAHPNVFVWAGVRDVTPDYSTTIFLTADELVPEDQDNPVSSQNTGFDVYARRADGPPELVSRGNSDSPDTDPTNASYSGRSADGGHILFETTAQGLVSGAAGQVPGSHALYDRVDGTTVLVGTNTDGTLTSACGSVIGSESFGDRAKTYGAVSDDGSRIAFTSPDPAGVGVSSDPSCLTPTQVYLRVDDQTTVDVSASQRTIGADPAGPQPAVFQGASSDWSKVFFLSTEALTDDVTSDGSGDSFLYEYNVSSGHLEALTPQTVRGVVGIDQSGSRIYVMTAAGISVVTSQGISPVASLSPSGDLISEQGATRLSSDGLHLLFRTASNVTSFDSHGAQELYLYDANDGGGGIRCVSCNADGHVPLGDASVSSDKGNAGPASGSDKYPVAANLSSDDQRVFFETPDKLASRDVNGVMDVYEWHDGAVHLISGGTGSDGSYFVGASADGQNVFLSTTDSLVTSDVDNGSNDIYDARVGGGFAEPSPARAPCQGDSCQGSPASPPALPAAGSTGYVGPGNVAAVPASAKTAVRLSMPATVHATGVTVTVKVPSKGSVTLSGTGLKAVKTRLAKSGTYHVRVRLSMKAQATLRRKHAYRTEVRGAFKPASGRASTATAHVTFKTKARS